MYCLYGYEFHELGIVYMNIILCLWTWDLPYLICAKISVIVMIYDDSYVNVIIYLINARECHGFYVKNLYIN
jgi:hypothetical protein